VGHAAAAEAGAEVVLDPARYAVRVAGAAAARKVSRWCWTSSGQMTQFTFDGVHRLPGLPEAGAMAGFVNPDDLNLLPGARENSRGRTASAGSLTGELCQFYIWCHHI
jgi:hypothetical protein